MTLSQSGVLIAAIVVSAICSGVLTSFAMRLNLVDKLVAIVAPKIMGKGIEAVGELNIADVSQALKLSFSRTYRLGEDLIIEARVETGWK